MTVSTALFIVAVAVVGYWVGRMDGAERAIAHRPELRVIRGGKDEPPKAA